MKQFEPVLRQMVMFAFIGALGISIIALWLYASRHPEFCRADNMMMVAALYSAASFGIGTVNGWWIRRNQRKGIVEFSIL